MSIWPRTAVLDKAEGRYHHSQWPKIMDYMESHNQRQYINTCSYIIIGERFGGGEWLARLTRNRSLVKTKQRLPLSP